MSRIHPEYLEPETADRLVAADVLLLGKSQTKKTMETKAIRSKCDLQLGELRLVFERSTLQNQNLPFAF
jgi:urease accessory protein UreH